MKSYLVLKDFPSRNATRQYIAGTAAYLAWNSRTKALEEMGYIEQIKLADGLSTKIATAVKDVLGLDCEVEVDMFSNDQFLVKVSGE